jgi:hypothetical protein
LTAVCRHFSHCINLNFTCAVKGAGSLRVKVPPGNWFAPPGSNRSGGEGNEAVGAFGVEGREGDLASMQAVTCHLGPKRPAKTHENLTGIGQNNGRWEW